ncbi:hypothetical protein [Streptomyces sp. UNOC14_S4]|uniref:hypothetical protein n=1 Tax=Streptomyces sp. UNOC14_S4 TaxID=2872340 RepID=UPI001E5C1FBC|nr:hypothetical protein [Streptomyces sp. UNOC14_S4]MCC3768096.1 hypothetical protein [Streptomyces sp. UNOC14_S4]
MIKATYYALGRTGRLGRNAEYWLHFNSGTLIELPEQLAAELVRDFADRLGLHVWAEPGSEPRPRRRAFRWWRRHTHRRPVPVRKVKARGNSPIRVGIAPFRRVRSAEN